MSANLQQMDRIVSRPARIPVLRFTVTGAITMAALFASCWVGVLVVPNLVSHMFVQLFTAAPISSGTALFEGLSSSLIFGALTGLVVAWVYNSLAFLDRK